MQKLKSFVEQQSLPILLGFCLFLFAGILVYTKVNEEPADPSQNARIGEINGGGGGSISIGSLFNIDNIDQSPTATTTIVYPLDASWVFAVGTSTPVGQYGVNTVSIYGSTTMQTQLDTEFALLVLNSATGTVFQVDTVNSSTTAFGTFNTGVLNVASCNGCSAASVTTPDWFTFADYMTPTTSPLGIIVASSTIVGDFKIEGGATTTNGFSITNITSCTDALETDSAGNVVCGTDATATALPDWFVNAGDTAFRPTTTLGITVHASSSIAAGFSFEFGTTSNGTSTDWATTRLTLGSTEISDIGGTGLTVTGGTLNCDTASASAQGCLLAADWVLFNDKVSTTSIDTLAEVETLWSVSNILVEADIDASSELLALMDDETGTGFLTFATLPSLIGFISTASSTIQTLQVQDTLSASSTLIVNGLSILNGVLSVASSSFGGTLELPMATSPALGATNLVSINQVSTGTAFEWHDGTARRSVSDIDIKVMPQVSTSTIISWGGSPSAGVTTTIQLGEAYFRETWLHALCTTVDNLATSTLVLYDGVNRTEYVEISGTGTTSLTFATNNVFDPGDDKYMDIQYTSGTVIPSPWTCTFPVREQTQ